LSSVGVEGSKGTSESSEDTTWTTQITSINGKNNRLVNINVEVLGMDTSPGTIVSIAHDQLSVVVELEGVVNIEDGLDGFHLLWSDRGGWGWSGTASGDGVAANHGGHSSGLVGDANLSLVLAT